MAVSRRQIFICDKHDNEGEEVIITGDSLFGFDGVWYKIGFCPICDKELISAAREFITEHGIKLDATDVVPTKPAAGSKAAHSDDEHIDAAPCIWCPYSGTSGALQYHVRSSHGFSGFKEAFGKVCPVCGTKPAAFLAQHGKKEHGTQNIGTLFQLAIKLGDLHGVVAERLRAAA
jgi:hypothetical protein